MAKKRSIRVRLSHQRIEALLDLCTSMRDTFEPKDEHHQLLREYMGELKTNLGKMVTRQQGNYTLSMTGAEAIAFRQLWQQLDIRHDKYAFLIVENLIKKMDAIAA